jgi:hypothetical protein
LSTSKHGRSARVKKILLGKSGSQAGKEKEGKMCMGGERKEARKNGYAVGGATRESRALKLEGAIENE